MSVGKRLYLVESGTEELQCTEVSLKAFKLN